MLSAACSPRALPPSPTRRSSDLGTVDIAAGAEHWRDIGCRASVFDASPDVVYAAADDGAHVRAQTDAEVALCFCESDRPGKPMRIDRKSTRLNSSHLGTSYAVCGLLPPCSTPLSYPTLFRSRDGRHRGRRGTLA